MSSKTLFGEHLRREREMRGVSLEEISAATRISVRFLEALENEEWARLPGGIFNRGFIRSIARFLGLDEDGLVAEYALETRERPEIARWTKEPVRQRRNWLPIIVTCAILAVLIAAGWYAHDAYGSRISAWRAQHPIVSTVMARLSRKKIAEVPGAPAPTTQNSTSGTAASAANTNANKASVRSGTSTAGAGGEKPQTAGAVAVSTSATAKTLPATPASARALTLKVEAGETSTVVVTADGKVVFSGKLDALKTLTLHAQRSFTVSSSKSNAVLLELNGNTIPPIGPPNQPGKITLTRANLKASPGNGY